MSGDKSPFRRLWCRGSLLIIGAILLVGYSVRQVCLIKARHALSERDAQIALDWTAWVNRLGPDSSEAHFLAARACRRLGNVEGMKGHLERAHELGWPAERLDREWILAQAQAGLLEQAEPHFQELFTNPGDDGV